MVVSDSVQNPPYIVRLQWSRGVQRLYKPQGYNGCMQTRHNVWFVFFFVLFFSILQCLKRGRMHPGARRPVPAPSAWDIRLVSALRLCWRGSQPPQEGEYIYIERDHYRTMAFRRYGHFYTHRSPAQTLLRWEDVPHAGDTRFLPTVFLLVLWGRNERKSTCCLANLLAKVSITENSL